MNLTAIHQRANEILYEEFPSHSMARLEECPEGSIKEWQVENGNLKRKNGG